MVTQNTARFTVYTKPELKELAEKIAKENRTSKSRVISQCLEELARSRKEKLMIEYYKTMAQEHADFAKKSAKVIDRIVSSWGD